MKSAWTRAGDVSPDPPADDIDSSLVPQVVKLPASGVKASQVYVHDDRLAGAPAPVTARFPGAGLIELGSLEVVKEQGLDVEHGADRKSITVALPMSSIVSVPSLPGR